jgi:dTDP-L-rhamnose 4-epimerase
MKSILITGGAGFIGSNLAHKLTAKGHKVKVLDNLSKQVHGDDPERTSPLFRSLIKNPEIHFIKGSVTSRIDWQRALSEIDTVVHLAAETGTGQSMYEIEKYVSVNSAGTALMLDILANEKNTVKKIIVASSRAIYGEGKYQCIVHGNVYPEERRETDIKLGQFECKCPICDRSIKLMATDEESKIHPTSVYGITKQNQEQMVLVVAKSIGLDAVSFRYQNVYGPGQSLSNPYTGILSIFSTQIKNGNNINIFEDGLESRDFVYIDDVVDATILGIESSENDCKIFNIGAGRPINVITVAKTLRDTFKTSTEINISGSYRLGDIRHNYADISLAKMVLGYNPRVNFEDGINKFCQWVNNQTIPDDKYDLSIEEMKVRGIFK